MVESIHLGSQRHDNGKGTFIFLNLFKE